MYKIYANGQPLYNPELVEYGYNIISADVTMELNKAGTLSFKIPQENVMYNTLKKLKTIITVFDNEEEIFRGRILSEDKDFYNNKDVYCEGELSFLLDSRVRPYTHKGSVRKLFEKFINDHNEMVEEEKRFEVGIVTVRDPNDYINRSRTGEAVDTLSEIDEKLIQTLGGYIRTRKEGNKRRIDYISDYDSINNQVIQFGENLLDLKEYITAEDVFTCLIPYGAEVDGNLTGIKAVNNGLDYIENQTAIGMFGRIWKSNQWKDVTEPENLLRKAREYLDASIEMSVSLSVKAVDLHLLSTQAERIKLGDKVRVLSLEHGIDKYFVCSKVSLNLLSPENNEYTLGFDYRTLTEKQLYEEKSTKTSNSVTLEQIKELESKSEGVKREVADVKEIVAVVNNNYVSVESFNTYKSEIESRITNIYRVKGSVQTESELPVSNKVGDVYNILQTGANYVWTDAGWDKLSETIDLSNLAKNEDLQALNSQLVEIINRIENLEKGGV